MYAQKNDDRVIICITLPNPAHEHRIYIFVLLRSHQQNAEAVNWQLCSWYSDIYIKSFFSYIILYNFLSKLPDFTKFSMCLISYFVMFSSTNFVRLYHLVWYLYEQQRLTTDLTFIPYCLKYMVPWCLGKNGNPLLMPEKPPSRAHDC